MDMNGAQHFRVRQLRDAVFVIISSIVVRHYVDRLTRALCFLVVVNSGRRDEQSGVDLTQEVTG